VLTSYLHSTRSLVVSWIVQLDYWTARQALAVQVVVLHLECEYSTTWTSFHRTVATTTRTPRKKWNPRTFEYFYYFIACVIEITEFSFSLAPCILGIYTYFNILLRNRWIHEASVAPNFKDKIKCNKLMCAQGSVTHTS